MKTIVTRSMWHRGRGGQNSALLVQETGKMCCLGFVSLQCGLTKSDIASVPYTSSSKLVHKQQLFIDHDMSWLTQIAQSFTTKNKNLVTQAMEVNDDMEITDEVREAELKRIFKEAGHEIEFVD